MVKASITASIISASVFLISLSGCSRSAVINPEITVDELQEHIFFLASDSLQGRYPGTEGDYFAASYIRKRFIESGLKVAGNDGFQTFSVITHISPGENNSLAVGEEIFLAGEDFTPMPFSNNGTVTAGVVFCGYGFSISEHNLKWDDYAGVDVTGRWVLVLRGDPEPDDPESAFALHSGDRAKAYLAAEKGAAGILLVSGEKFDREDELAEIRIHQGKLPVPVIQITRPVADLILAPAGSTLPALETSLAANMAPGSFITHSTVTATASLEINESNTMNVIAVLEGSDPVLKNEYILLGAHYDHLGTGGAGSGSRRPAIQAVHPGADDNASGVASMLEIAGRLESARDTLKRSYLFVAFGAEEKGLIGSRFFTENPVVDLSAIKAMINLDMIGRKSEDKNVQIGGIDTSDRGREIITRLGELYGFNLSLTGEGYGPSDHASFYARDIPVFFITTGAHPDYHTPDDTADRINYEGLKTISDFTSDLLVKLGNTEESLAFREAGPRAPVAPRHGNRRVSLGIMPDFASTGVNGLRADFVTPGRPADQGGMKQGDLIIAINGNPVGDIYEYMYRLDQLRPGEIINVEVVRNGRNEVLIIQL